MNQGFTAVTWKYPKSRVRVVRTVHPAHLRYYDLIGFAVEDLGDSWRVLVRGVVDVGQAFIGAALLKKGS